MSIRRSGTVVNTVQCQEGEASPMTREKGLRVCGRCDWSADRSAHARLCAFYSKYKGNHQWNDTIPLMCSVVQRLQQWCSGQ